MKIKIFQPNQNGKIEFTLAELTKLLNEIYEDGYHDGFCYGEATGPSPSCPWVSPSVTNQHYYAAITSAVDNDKNIDQLVCSRAPTDEKKVTTIAPVYTALDGREDMDKLTHAIDSLIASAKVSRPDDVFTKLAKELNF
jgi:hypothetical protein